VVLVAAFEWLITRQQIYDGHQLIVENVSVLPLGFALVVPLEG